MAFKPVIRVTNNDYSSNEQSARLINYVKGVMLDVMCIDDGFEGTSGDISVSRQIYAHRAIPEVLVQEIKVINPTGKDQSFRLERLGK